MTSVRRVKRELLWHSHALEIRGTVRRQMARTPARHPHPMFHVCSVLNVARTSSVKYFGCSHAMKWQPFGGRP
jgi:hypothetical protein